MGLYNFETEGKVVKMANDTSMGLASNFFTKNIDRTWRLLENLGAGMIGMNTGKFDSFPSKNSISNNHISPGNSSAAESPFGGIKEPGKEAGKDVAIEEYLIIQDWHIDSQLVIQIQKLICFS
jgi:succinate-semialdehyde dehydrogenase/glutarate-semialdehyde dehydrogenase